MLFIPVDSYKTGVASLDCRSQLWLEETVPILEPVSVRSNLSDIGSVVFRDHNKVTVPESVISSAGASQ